MSSRRTSDVHDRLSEKRGFSGGKQTTFKGEEPEFSFDYNDAAANLAGWKAQGGRRYGELIRDGAKPARGSRVSRFGFTTGSFFGSAGITIPGEPGSFGALLLAESLGVSVWAPTYCSADAFQHCLRGGASGLTTDADNGYLFVEDPENPQYSIVIYRRYGTIPKAQVVKAYQDGLIQEEIAKRYGDLRTSEQKNQEQQDQSTSKLDELDRQIEQAKQDAELAEKQRVLDELRSRGTVPPLGQTPPPAQGFKTLEIYGRLNGQMVPLKQVLAPGTLQLVPGGKAVVGDAPTDGYGFAGTPGKWSQVAQGTQPADWGLDQAIGIVWYDGAAARPVSGTSLSQIFGSDWRQKIY